MAQDAFCLGCLSTNSRLINLTKNQYSIFAGLIGFPMDYRSPSIYLCYICYGLFIKFTRFREKCKRAQHLLMESTFNRTKITNSYISSIDRNLHNLTSNLTIHSISYDKDIVIEYDSIKEEPEETKLIIEPVFIKEAESSIDDYSLDSDSSVDEKVLNTHFKLKNNRLVEYKTFFDQDAFEKSYNMSVIILSKEEQLREIVQRKETSKSSHKCNECGKEFKSDLNLNAHFKSFHIPSIGGFVCDICKVRFGVKNKLLTHLDNHKFIFKCKECDFVCRAKSTAKTHRAWHKGLIYTCPYCDKIFEKITTRLSHVRFNHASELKFCEYCGESFIGKVGLNAHKKRVHKEMSLAHKCSSCGLKFATEEALVAHTNCDYCGKISCVVCGDSFDSDEFLRNHLVQTHRPRKLMDLKCERCGDQFDSSKALINHMKAERCKGGCSCVVCGECFENEEQLRSHDAVHEKDRRFKCRECNRSFASSENYNDHYDRIHTGKKRKRTTRRTTGSGGGGAGAEGKRRKPEGEDKFAKKAVCEICGKGFKNGALLRYHQRVHTGEKPYPCPECPKRFSMPLLLQLHLRVHTGERPYQCEYCPKAFKSKTAVNRHILIHTGERRHVCQMCNKTFITSSDMKSHVQAVHLKAPRQAQRVRTKREPAYNVAQ